jgi:tagatose 1,6-diphosphate aldolase GatY/KbaY
VPVAIHLDHGDSFELAMRAIRGGYTSIMIDGSRLPFEKNIELTARVVSVAHPGSLPVEAELGMVGGKEDDTVSGDSGYTDPSEAAEFIARTGADSLAVGIGTAHGIYKGPPKLDIGRVADIRKRVDVPLVLHGASGLPDGSVRECVKNGICKVNYATELRIAYTAGVREALKKDAKLFDPKKYCAPGRENVRRFVAEKMRVCGCVGVAR